MDGRDIGNAFAGAMGAMYFMGIALGVAAGIVGGGIVFWLLPFLWRHISIAWN